MPANRLNSFSRALLKIYGLPHVLGVKEFQDGALDAIQDILPFDSSMWGSATLSEKGVDIHTLHLYKTSSPLFEDHDEVQHLDHFVQDVVSRRINTIRFSASDERKPEHNAFLVKHRHFHGLISQSINPQTQVTQWLSLFRSDPAHVCSEEEVQLLEKIFPHLMQALAINRKAHLEQMLGNERRGRWSVAIADHQGFLYHADKEFLQILGKDYAIQHEARIPPVLAGALTQAVPYLTSAHSVLSCAIEGDLLFLKIRAKVPADSLSEKEFVVAKMLASGLSLKEIALKLDRSPDTIRSHGKAIYQKLGTNKVTQLASLLIPRE